MHTIKFLTYNKTFPSEWNELTRDQLLFISSMVANGTGKETFNVRALQYFTQIPWKDFFKINEIAIKEMADKIEWIHKKRELTINLIPELAINGMDVQTHGRASLQGPSDSMLNASFEQFFGHTEPAFSAFANTQNAEMLNYLVASLYSFENDEFNPKMVELNKNLVTPIDAGIKTAILFFYMGCRDLMANKYPDLFKKSKTKSASGDLDYFEMIDGLNNENLTGNEAIKRSNLWEAFTRLTAMIEKSRKIKQHQQKRR